MNLLPTLSGADHRRIVAERRKNSLGWGVIHLFGSLKMAVLLLTTIALACAVATFTESGFSTKVAQYYIYKAPWFLGWLGILCLNLFCVTLTRWPWQRQHHGFVLTHFGIITLLAGAVIGRLTGFEAFVTLDEGEPPQARVEVQESTLQIQTPTTGTSYGISLPVEAAPPDPAHPRLLSIPGTPWKIRIDDYSSRLIEKQELSEGSSTAGPGVALAFHSNMMKQNLDFVLLRDSAAANRRDFFGRASIEWSRSPLVFNAPSEKPWRESQLLFAIHPQDSLIIPEGKRSGWHLQLLAASDNKNFNLTAMAPDGKTAGEWPLTELTDQPFLLPGEHAQIKVMGFWPDFTMVNGQPTSRSQNPLNPALLVQIGPIDPTSGPNKPTLRLFSNSAGGLDYQLLRGWTAYNQGTLQLDQPLTLGWADWQLTMVEYRGRAEISTHVVKPDSAQSNPLLAGLPGIHIALVDDNGHSTAPIWLISGTTANLVLNDVTVPVRFGLKSFPLPFGVSLEKFEVPFYEGTENPSNYISTIRFDDFASGTSRVDRASMNTPATYPGGFWRSALGRNYKFSQASWNPQNLKETTLQILYDPGWPFKWIGSLMVVMGIFMLFYLRPQPATTRRPLSLQKLDI